MHVDKFIKKIFVGFALTLVAAILAFLANFVFGESIASSILKFVTDLLGHLFSLGSFLLSFFLASLMFAFSFKSQRVAGGTAALLAEAARHDVFAIMGVLLGCGVIALVSATLGGVAWPDVLVFNAAILGWIIVFVTLLQVLDKSDGLIQLAAENRSDSKKVQQAITNFPLSFRLAALALGLIFLVAPFIVYIRQAH